MGVVVVAYTCYGGLRASIYTDRIQFRALMPVAHVRYVAGAAGFGGE